MRDEPIQKKKFKIDLQTFVSICIFVFGLWAAWANLHSTQVKILEEVGKLSVQQEKMITMRDEQHLELDKQIAWILPTIHTLAKRAGLE